MSLARQRLVEERKTLRKERPFGFSAKPRTLANGETDLMTWEAGVPGPDGSPFGGATFKLTLQFNDAYPREPPIVFFTPPVFHINVFPNGQICMSLLYSDKDWRPNISIAQLLLGIQELFDNPNPASVACDEAYQLYKASPAAYVARQRAETAAYKLKHNVDG